MCVAPGCLTTHPCQRQFIPVFAQLRAKKAPRPRLERGTYCLGVRFAVGPGLRTPTSGTIHRAHERPLVTLIVRPFWHGYGTQDWRFRGGETTGEPGALLS